MQWIKRIEIWLLEVAQVPWLKALLTLRERFREDRLSLIASSLTFNTLIALVPSVVMGLAVFTAFPMFAKFQDVLQKWLIESLVPDSIARQVLGYLNQFAGHAKRLGFAGFVVFIGSALMLVFTIDRTLNTIWRVRTPRPLAQRLMIYWSTMTLGPLLLGVSVTMTSYALSASRGVVGGLPGGVGLLIDVVQFFVLAGGVALMFRYVPNTHVRWNHAWMGGVFVSLGLELAKKAVTVYLSSVPTYSLIYGAFATVPILLFWIYLAWLIVLLGAALTAYLPSLITGATERKLGRGWQFQLALEALKLLDNVRLTQDKGLSLNQLCLAMRVDPLRLEPVLQEMTAMDWIGQLRDPSAAGVHARYVLLADPATAMAAPLAQRLLLEQTPATEKIWQTGRWPATTLRDLL